MNNFMVELFRGIGVKPYPKEDNTDVYRPGFPDDNNWKCQKSVPEEAKSSLGKKEKKHEPIDHA